MHYVGEYIGAQRDEQGDMVIAFALDEKDFREEELNKYLGEKVTLDVGKFKKKRSNEANAYLWKLCELIAEKLECNKDTVYEMCIKDYGVFEDYEIPLPALGEWRKLWRFVDVKYTYDMDRVEDCELVTVQMIGVRCYVGSHEYDQTQMSRLITGVVNVAKDLGLDTWTQDEIAHAISLWEAR